MKDQAHDEIQHAFDTCTDKTKTAIAQVTELYIRQHKDRKHYIQVDAVTSEGTRQPGFLPFGFTTEQKALQFQNKCFDWFIRETILTPAIGVDR